MSKTENFSKEDLVDFKARGLKPEEADRQVNLLRSPASFTQIERPCKIGDGIMSITEAKGEELVSVFESSLSQKKITEFIPASGAATRMFKDLQVALDKLNPNIKGLDIENNDGTTTSLICHTTAVLDFENDKELKVAVNFCTNLHKFAFSHDINQFAAMCSLGTTTIDDLSSPKTREDYIKILSLVLNEDCLNYAQLPKGLLKFHKYNNETRTAFAEHLHRIAETFHGNTKVCNVHLTVSPEHREKFIEHFNEIREEIEHHYNLKLNLSFSVQKPSTDTLSVCDQKNPFRDENGKLIFRPGGHGALIENLNDLVADLALITNIDNVQTYSRSSDARNTKKVLGGLLLKTQEKVFSHLKALNDSVDDKEGILNKCEHLIEEGLCYRFNRETYNNLNTFEEKKEFLSMILNRPIRVCGVVKNSGQPGGGPFWVKDKSGNLSLQIVEKAQIDSHSPSQNEIFAGSSHFNPVNIVCGLTDYKGEKFDLNKFVDHDAIIIAEKSHKGRTLKSFERPGLWNGSMANWITVFVEVPATTFTPVKTIMDLLSQEHRE